MKSILSVFVPLAAFVALAGAVAQSQEKDKTPDKKGAKGKEIKITWKKTVLDKKFRGEGAAVGDVNGDGKKDILVGDYWYEAPNWKPNAIRKLADGKEKNFGNGAGGYSDSFAVFADDIDKDGLIDMVVVGFPGEPCYWYKNPGKEAITPEVVTFQNGRKPDKTQVMWKQYLIQDNACNETPLYADLLGVGKKGLLLAHRGEIGFFLPSSDPTKPWRKISISGEGKKVPGTNMFSHGFGATDINGDGKLDVVVNGGWWEQPGGNATKGDWPFHPVGLQDCADIYAFDIDGDGKNDLITSAAHRTGIQWHQQKAPAKEGDHPAFVGKLMWPLPTTDVKAPADWKFTKDEEDLFKAINKVRTSKFKLPWKANLKLCGDARSHAAVAAAHNKNDGKFSLTRAKYDGETVAIDYGEMKTTIPDTAAYFFEKYEKLIHPGLELGVGFFEAANGKKHYLILVGDSGQFVTPGQTHAMHFVDIDGDGQKDLVTGRRWWAHGPQGDDAPGDPAFIYWFKAKKDKSGFTTFEPQLVDDDSGVGTQFAIEDVDGDGLLDIIVSNKKGVFLLTQMREEVIRPVPPNPDDN